MTNNLYHEKFQRLLRELFQLDCADLDFGIYRIMNYKRDVIEKFISTDLPKAIADELECGALANQSHATAELTETVKQIAKTFGKDALDTEGNLTEKYHNTPLGKKYLDLQGKATSGRGREALEVTIFNHLYSFFSRYYQDGDFISKRRYSKRQKYAIPYNGEEVYLHWANHDQYYVKTAEHFHDYTFNSRGVTVHFKLTAANVEQNNVKGDKRFFLSRVKEIEWKDKACELIIPFEFRPLTDQEHVTYGKKNQQDKIIDESLVAIPNRLKTAVNALVAITAERHKNSDGESVSFLEHHLRQYTRANTSDFFIHKDLKGFLSRELDFYLKNEVLNLNEMEAAGEDRSEGWFQVLQIIRSVGNRIIEFLDQIETFQKMLWEKRKFITDTQYCISVGTIDETFYTDIADCETQWAEWKGLLHIDLENAELYSNGKDKKNARIAFLGKHPTLVVDTVHFPEKFTDAVLGTIEDVWSSLDGLLLHSDNYHALRLLENAYRDSFKCIYIDPPYNTSASAILYKNDYRHSSWCAMMYDRLSAAQPLLRSDGAIFTSIDKTERTVLEHAMDRVFGSDNHIEELIWTQNTANSQLPNYSTNHEYVEVYARDRNSVESDAQMFREPKPGFSEIMELVHSMESDYPLPEDVENAIKTLFKEHRRVFREQMEAKGYEWTDEIKKQDPWKGIYNYHRVEYRSESGEFIPYDRAKEREASIWVWREISPAAPASKQSDTTKQPDHYNYRYYKPTHPTTKEPCPHPKSGWKFPRRNDPAHPGRRTFEDLAHDHRIAWGEDEKKVPQTKGFLHEVETNIGTSSFYEYNNGEAEVAAMFGESGVFLSPKSSRFVRRFVSQTARKSDFVLDFFGGSGSTGHAVIAQNQEDGGQRRFVLVEVGHHFDSVMLRRIKKATFTPHWQNGEPSQAASKSEAACAPRLLQYCRLESYEDALGNIQAIASDGQAALSFDDYLLRYMLKWETRKSETLLNIEQLAAPFSYKLTIVKGDETIEKAIDLPETFNYLLGLHVSTRKVYDDNGRRYLVYHGSIDHRRIAVIWRETVGWQKKDLERDKKFVAEQKLAEGVDEVFVNGDSFLPNAKALDPVFKARMFSTVDA